MKTLTKSLTGLGLGVALSLTAGTAMAAGGGACGDFVNAEGVTEHLRRQLIIAHPQPTFN